MFTVYSGKKLKIKRKEEMKNYLTEKEQKIRWKN
jgi:hypothetical protein